MQIRPARNSLLALCTLVILTGGAACRRSAGEKNTVTPNSLSDVPATRLAYALEPDGAQAAPNPDAKNEVLSSVKAFFEANRKGQELLRTVPSPDGQRALAIYATETEEANEYRMDLFSADGAFLRNVTPPALIVGFPEMVKWSPDGNYIAFIGKRGVNAPAAPNPEQEIRDFSKDVPAPTPPDLTGSDAANSNGGATPPVAPTFAPVETFATEQIYLCNRDGYELRALTRRDKTIYFYIAWAPDAHALAVAACFETEWAQREAQGKLRAGRPRLLGLGGDEKLMSDNLADAPPVWSPDAAKIAAGFDTAIEIYDAAGTNATRARLNLREKLLQSSVAYDRKITGKDQVTNDNGGATENTAPPAALPVSFNPIMRLAWTEENSIVFQTAFMRLNPNGEPLVTFPRWHKLILTPQATVIGEVRSLKSNVQCRFQVSSQKLKSC